ncbi:MAG: autoinducer 2 ABC transporter substrate-binding protein [Mesorhizobium sp.]|nr:MAG: autoinducer 2 ABC transporter substrate-binding protein [Mesorhizobium sp.]
MLSQLRKVLAVSALSLVAVTAAHAADKHKVAFVPQLIGIPYFNAMEAGGNRAAKDLGVDFVYSGPVDTNPVDQLQIVQNLIDQGVEAVSVSVLDASSIAPVVESAKAKGIKLFTSDSDAPDSGRAVYVAQATASNLNAWIGFMQKEAAAKYPKLKLLAPQFAGGTAERAAQISGDLMAANPDIKAIIAVASSTCPGVAQAIETVGKIGSVIGTGYCSPNTARSYLKSGAFGFTVLWDPEQLGYLTVWAGKQLIDGKSFEAENKIAGLDKPATYDAAKGILLLGPPAVFTKDNVDKFNF